MASCTGHQTVMVSGFTMEASFKGSPPFKLLCATSVLVVVYTPVVIIFLHEIRPKNLNEEISPNKAKTCFYLLFFDMIMMALMISSWAAAGAIYYTCINGYTQLGWTSVCELVENFCKTRMIAVWSLFVAVVGSVVAATNIAYILRKMPPSTS